MPKVIIGLVGLPGAGKTTAATFLEREFGAGRHAFGDLVREEATKRNIPHTREALVALGAELSGSGSNEDPLARAMRERVEADPARLVVTEGFRFIRQVNALVDLPGFRLVAICANAELRWMRCLGRAEKPDERQMTFAQFRAWEESPTERGILLLMGMAAYNVQNDGVPLEGFHQSLRAAMRQLEIAPVSA
ncbi:hypothetical protein EPO33_05465 [Patescibacteria group bacterium]|nr:MAG: hypothetical protein EPO33_05465 [Patescibacteria group bacterium]